MVGDRLKQDPAPVLRAADARWNADRRLHLLEGQHPTALHDIHGQTSFGEVFPAWDGWLNAQFTPMIQMASSCHETGVLRCEPITGGIEKYAVHSAGTFKATT